MASPGAAAIVLVVAVVLPLVANLSMWEVFMVLVNLVHGAGKHPGVGAGRRPPLARVR